MTRHAAVLGAAHSSLVLEGPYDLVELTLDAIAGAIADAGLEPSSVDGLATYGKPAFPASREDGINTVGPLTVVERMSLPGIRWICDTESGLIMSAIAEAVHAVESGRCDVVVVWRSMPLDTGRYGAGASEEAKGNAAYSAPWGARSIIPWHALVYSRYLHEAGLPDDALANFVVASHRHAELNPSAMTVSRPVDTDEYLANPMVSDPLRRLDCDRPVAGCAAIVIASTTVADKSARQAVIAGMAMNTRPPGQDLHYAVADTYPVARDVADRLWSASGETPRTISVAQLYDGFSPTVPYWLEGLGLSRRGEAGHELAAGAAPLPINTFGGSLGEGRLHGIGHVIEGARQVSGRAGVRQVPDCRSAVVTIGSPLMNGGALVLRSD